MKKKQGKKNKSISGHVKDILIPEKDLRSFYK
jgi:hypothetical protein